MPAVFCKYRVHLCCLYSAAEVIAVSVNKTVL